MRTEDVYSLVRFGTVEGEDHTDTHIEDIEHLPVGYLAVFLEEMEDREYFP